VGDFLTNKCSQYVPMSASMDSYVSTLPGVFKALDEALARYIEATSIQDMTKRRAFLPRLLGQNGVLDRMLECLNASAADQAKVQLVAAPRQAADLALDQLRRLLRYRVVQTWMDRQLEMKDPDVMVGRTARRAGRP
jgi:hypothetical protein